MPKISIITPVYVNIDAKVNWLDEMIKSVTDQTFADWELILIDDKSPLVYYDDIKLKYANDGRLRWLKNVNNEGPARTRNTAVALAESDCILPLDSDDMLASDEVLERMYEVWSQDKSKTVYGNLQQLLPDSQTTFKRGKVIQLAEYSFEFAMNLNGIMPVTAMHSIKCHQMAGGWKHELNEGLEDVEYWIAAGERGFCGQKINYTTLLYRRQENSRAYVLKHVNQTLRVMQNKIKTMHAPIYKGEFPKMACGCSDNSSVVKSASMPSDPIVMSAQNKSIAKVTELKGYDDNELEWVVYQGKKQGSFSILVRGPSNLPSSYMVLGTGHAFQVHKRHHDFFSQRQHLGFRVNQPNPRQQPEPEIEIETNQPEIEVIELPRPELSTLLRLDGIGAKTRQADIQQVETRQLPKSNNEIIIEPNAPMSVSDTMVGMAQLNLAVSNLGLSDRLTETLENDNWTVEKIAASDISNLTKYSGIGKVRAQSLIDKARELIVRR